MRHLLIILVAFATIAVVGCSRKAETVFTGRMTVILSENGDIEIVRDAESVVTAETPADSAVPTTQDAGFDGASNSVSGSHTPAPIDQAVASLTSLPWIGTGLMLIGVTIAVLLGQRLLGAAITLAGIGLIAAPVLIDRFAGAIALVMLVAVGLLAAWGYREWRKQQGIKGVVKLAKDQQHDAAIAALRGVDPSIDAAFAAKARE